MTEEREMGLPKRSGGEEKETEAPASPMPGEGQAEAELASLRQDLAASQAKEAEYLDGWQRARAELANARKRFQREQETAYAHAQGDVWVRVLPLLDDFERAFATLPYNLSGLTWIEGVALIHRKLQFLLEQAGVETIEAAGRPFDPFTHQAISHEPSDSVPEGHVIAELQKGYKMGERVLRPVLVRVSSGAPAKAEGTGPGGPAPEQGEGPAPDLGGGEAPPQAAG